MSQVFKKYSREQKCAQITLIWLVEGETKKLMFVGLILHVYMCICNMESNKLTYLLLRTELNINAPGHLP